MSNDIKEITHTESINKKCLNSSSGSALKAYKKAIQKSNFEGIPLLNKDTASSNTYDIDMLLDSKVQKEANSSHRIKNSRNFAIVKVSNSKDSKKILSTTCKSLDIKLAEKKTEKSEKIEKLREEAIKKELEECTFHPKILGETKVRSPDEYYKDQLKYEGKKQEKIREIQKAFSQSVLTQMGSFTHVPSITEKSSLLASKHVYEENTYDRLHKGLKPKVTIESIDSKVDGEKNKKSEGNTESQWTFTPTLNIRSKNLLRIAPVDEILYEDAKRRQRDKNEQKIMLNYESSVNPSSEKMLIEKFYKEFIDICNWDDIIYTDFQMILQSMFFILGLEKHKNKEIELSYKLWSRVSQNNDICSNERLIMTLLAVMKYQGSVFANSDEAISPEETESIHLQYFLFYENRISITNKSSINRSIKNEQEYSFSPDICPNSRKIAEQTNIDDIIKKKKQKKMEVIREVEEKIFEECTFQPMISPIFLQTDSERIKDPIFKEYLQISSDCDHRGEMLYNFSQVAKEKKELIIKEEQEKLKEQELIKCTFSPDIGLKDREKKITSSTDIKSTVKRLSKAKEQSNSAKSLTMKKKNNQEINKLQHYKKKSENFDYEYEKEKKLQEWEDKKLKEIRKKKQEHELKLKSERELELEKRKKIEEEKKARQERLKKINEEKKIKSDIEKKKNARVRKVSLLSSFNSSNNTNEGYVSPDKEIYGVNREYMCQGKIEYEGDYNKPYASYVATEVLENKDIEAFVNEKNNQDLDDQLT